MQTKNKKLFFIIGAVVFMMSCTKQPYYDIPTDASGRVVITGVSTATSDGISTLDDKFTVNATFPNAKAGDVMKSELLKLQPPPQGGTEQLLPLAGTQKSITVGADLKASVTYTRAEAKLINAGDFATVTFAGKTDANIIRVDLKTATSIAGPLYGGKSVDVTRTGDTSFIDILVQPKLANYAGTVTVKRKNGVNAPWVNVGTGSYPANGKVPVSANDFAAGKDTMYYSFVATNGSYKDSITTVVVLTDPSFFLKKTGTLSLANAGQQGMNLLTNTSVAVDNGNAIISVSNNSLLIKSGPTWGATGKNISFVPSTVDMYNRNNSADAITAFQNGASTSFADPNLGAGIYIFKIINGPSPSDVIYGMIKILKIVPGVSIDYEYRIGNSLAHLSVIK
jgi:hypothetical protein